MKKWLPLLSLLCCLLWQPSHAEENLQSLYEKVKAARIEQAAINRQREQRFLAEQQTRQQQLKELQQQVTEKQQALQSLRTLVAEGDDQIDQLRQQLSERSHDLADLYSVWRQVAADTRSNMQHSLVVTQYPQLNQTLEQLMASKRLPTPSDLQALTQVLQQDLQASGASSLYPAPVAGVDGVRQERQVQRIGPFSVTAGGRFLRMDTGTTRLSEVARQPDQHYLTVIEQTPYQSLQAGQPVLAVLDPSRGVVLDQLALSPDLTERLQQGGLIGYVIIALGAAGLLLALWRVLVLAITAMKVRQQMRQPERIDQGNPLGRIMAVYHTSVQDEGVAPSQETDALEVRLQQIVLQEMPRLDRGLGLLKLLAAVAPLLGLLGTVVGMINTFQTITLVGSADPKMMAGGISQALMTTVLGLIVAVPLLFGHNFVAARARTLMVFLSQQSLGLIALSLEQQITKPSGAASSGAEERA